MMSVIMAFLVGPRNGFAVIVAAERFEEFLDSTTHVGQSDDVSCGTRAMFA
jgi:hypothetical protein